MSPLEWLASQGAPAATTAKGSGNDVVPSNWTHMVPASKIDQVMKSGIPKGNYKEIPNPMVGGTGTVYLLRPLPPPTKWEINPIKAMWWRPAPGPGGWLSPQIGDNRRGTIDTLFVDKNGKCPTPEAFHKWHSSLTKDQKNAWENGGGGGGGGGVRWAYKEKGTK